MGPAGGRRASPHPRRSLTSDRRGQQFVLEVAVVAILVASTVVLVTSLSPTQPGIEDPRTHQRTATQGQDILDAMAAESVPRCTEVSVQGPDGESVDRGICPGRELLDRMIVADLLGNTSRTCDEISAQVGPGKQVAVLLHGAIRSKVLCGDLPAPEDPTASQAAFSTTVLAFNYTHTFTDLDTYNGDDPTAIGRQITSDGDVHTQEARAWQRVTTVPTRMSWPVVPAGDAVEAEVTVQGGAVGGNQTLEAAGSTEESSDGGLEYASFYGEDIPWCPEGWNPTNDTCIGDGAASLEDEATYDWNLDGRYFPPDGADPETSHYQSKVTFKIRVNETTASPIDGGTLLLCQIPPDWTILDVDGDADLWGDDIPPPEGSSGTGWTIRATLEDRISDSNATLQITATPPNPSNTDTSDDPARPVYVFRCWLENDAHSVLDIPVDLRPSDVGEMPITSGVIATVSPASGMDTEGEGWWGVSVVNPTSESLEVTRVRVSSLSETALFRRLNRTVLEPEGLWEIKGLTGVQERLRNGGFEQGLTGWNTSRWRPDTTWSPPYWANRTSVTSDSLGRGHVLYSRSDGRIVHMTERLDTSGQKRWDRETTPFFGLLGPRSAVVEQGPTSGPDGDRIHLFFRGREARSPGPGLWHAVRTEAGWQEPERLAGMGEFKGATAHPTGMRAFRDDGALHLVFMVRTEGGTPEPQANFTGSDHVFYMVSDASRHDEPSDCDFASDGWRERGWWCRTIFTGEGSEARKMSAFLGPERMHFLFQVNIEPLDFRVRYCRYPCRDRVDIAGSRSMWTGQPVDLIVDDAGTPHAAYSVPENGMFYARAVTDSPLSPTGPACTSAHWQCTAISSDAGWEVALTFYGPRKRVEILYNNIGNVEMGRLWHAWPSSGSTCGGAVGWSCGPLDAPGSGLLLALHTDARGIAHTVSLGADGTPTEGSVRYMNSRLSPGRWAFEDVPTISREAHVGGSIRAVADDRDDVHVAYQDETTDTLMYARFDASTGSWTAERVDTGLKDLGWRSDITVVDGEPWIAYYADGRVRVANRTGDGCGVAGNWTCETIDLATGSVSRKQDLAIDHDDRGKVFVLFQNRAEGLEVAHKEPGGTACRPDSTWTCQTVAARDVAVIRPDLAVQGDTIHATWYADGMLKHSSASRSLGVWSPFDPPSTLDAAPGAGVGPVIDTDGTRVGILYGGAFPEDQGGLEGTGTRYIEDVTDPFSTDTCLDTWTCRDVMKSGLPDRGDLVLEDGTVHAAHVDRSGSLTYVREDGDASCGRFDGFACTSLLTVDPSRDAGDHSTAIVRTDDPAGDPVTTILYERGGRLRAMTDRGADGTCPGNVDWRCELVDDGNHSAMMGGDPAVAVDGEGRPHVVHHDRGTGNLLYTIRDAGRWRTEIVDRGWALSEGGIGVASAWDDAGRMHAIYRDETLNEIRYLTNASGAFASTTVDLGNATSFDAAVRDGTLHATWYDRDAQALVHGQRVGDGRGQGCANVAWRCTIVDEPGPESTDLGDPSLGVEADGRVTIAYQKRDAELWAARTGGDGTGCSGGADRWTCTAVDDAGSTGFEPSVDVAPDGTVGIAYYDDGLLEAKYVADEGEGFGQPQIVDTPGTSGAGRYVSLAFDTDSRPRLAYWAWSLQAPSGFNDYLYHAVRDGSGWELDRVGNWSNAWLEEVSLDVDRSGRASITLSQWMPGRVFRVASQAEDGTCTDRGGEASGWSCRRVDVLDPVEHHRIRSFPRPHVAAYSPISGTVQIGRETGQGWEVKDLPAGARVEGDVGYYADLALEETGGEPVPHVSYYDRGRGAVKHATRDGDGWEATTVEGLGDTGLFTSIALDDGDPSIAYYDVDRKDWTTGSDPQMFYEGLLRFAWRDHAGWHTELVNGTRDRSWDTGRYASLEIGAAGRPVIAYQHMQPTGSGDSSDLVKQLVVAVRDRQNRACPEAPNWSCVPVEEVTTGFQTSNGLFSATAWDAARTAIWPSLAIGPEGVPSALMDRVDADGDHSVRLVREGAVGSACSESMNWSCDDLEGGPRTPYYAALSQDEIGHRRGVFTRPTDPTEETDAVDTLPGSWRPVTSDLVAVTDAVGDTASPCTRLSTFECRTVLQDRRVARPSIAISDGSRAHLAAETADADAFLFGSNRDWGRLILEGGINYTIEQQGLQDNVLNVSRAIETQTLEAEASAIGQEVVVDGTPSAALLGFDWTKDISASTTRDNLDLRAFNVTATIERLDGSGDGTVVWSDTRIQDEGAVGRGSERVDVTALLAEPGRYRLRFHVHVVGKMEIRNAEAVLSFRLDDVSLRTYRHKLMAVNNSGFLDRDDWMGYDSAPDLDDEGWTLARDGGWRARSRFGDRSSDANGVDVVQYAKTWNATRRPGELSDSDRHTAVEAVALGVWSSGEDPIQGEVSNGLSQPIQIPSDGSLSAVRLHADLYSQGRAYVSPGEEKVVDHTTTPRIGSLDDGTTGHRPECRMHQDPVDDPCSAYFDEPTPGVRRPFFEEDGNLSIRATLVHESGDETSRWFNRSLDSLCRSTCRLGPWDLTSFVRARSGDRDNYTLVLDATLTWRAEDPIEGPASSDWILYQVVTGMDDILVEADFGGGTTVQWTGQRTVPERSSRDWVFRPYANAEGTFAAGDRVWVDADYDNGFGTEALHMPRYGMYQVDVRPENATCDPFCKGEGGGYDINTSACVTGRIGVARAAARGRACYKNDPNAFLTRGIEQAVRDKSITEVPGGEGRFNTFPARDPDGSCNHARVAWNFTKVRESYRRAVSGTPELEDVSIGRVELTLHSPAFGAPVWRAGHGNLSGTDRIRLCDLFFEGAYVLEAEMPVRIEAADQGPEALGTVVTVQTARKVDYLTVVPPDPSDDDPGPGLSAVGVELRTWWRSG